MAGVLETLKQIHEVRRDLTDVRQQMKQAPIQLRGRESLVRKMKERIATEKDAAKKIRVDADSRELTLKQAESRIRDLRTKLNQVESNKEYQAIQEEIKRIETDNDTLQEAILEKITEEEAKRAEVKGLEGELAKLEEDLAKFKGVVDYKIEKLNGQQKILEEKLAELEPQLGDALGDYRRLTATKGDDGIAECVGNICQNCFNEQPPQSWQELLNGRPVKCRACNALMFKS